MRPLVLPVLSVWLLLSVRFAGAQEPFDPVKDEAHLFDLPTHQQAYEELLDLWHQHRLRVKIETVASAPKGSKVARTAFVTQRAAALKADGLFVLICNDPHDRFVQVIAWPKESESEYTSRDCERLRKAFVNTEKKQKANKALLALVEEIRKLADEKAAPPSAFPWTTVVAIVLAVLGAWLILGLVRMRLHAAESQPADERHQGLAPGLLGGLFGAVAGHWIYDTIFHRGGTPPPEKQEPKAPAPTEPAKEETPVSPH